MGNGRTTGMILMALSSAAFLGSTSEMLPAATFFPALALFAAGAIQFLVANRAALEVAEQRTQAKLHPVLSEDRSALAAAERRARRQGAALQSLNADPVGSAGTRPSRPPRVQPGAARTPSPSPALYAQHDSGSEIDLVDACEDEDDELQISQDVSFPIEIQRGDALADQLRKLNQLLTQGVLTEQEYALAKAKLLA